MKIVHEIYGRAQVGGTVSAYKNAKGDAKGGRCDIVMTVPGSDIGEEEAVFIEGDVDDVIDMLLDALRVIQLSTEDTGLVFQRPHDGFPISRGAPA